MNRRNRSLIITSLVAVAAALVQGARAPAASAQVSINLLDGNPKNGLSSQAFLRNALTTNPEALKQMRTQPLSQGLMADPVIRLQLNERGARAVMAEIIKCALAPAQRITYVDDAGTSWPWQGELGLCQHAGTEVGDWSVAAPTPACQELVTACVMARVNALGMAVPLSLRGQPAPLFPSRPVVATERRWRERRGTEDPAEGTPVDSFNGPLCQIGHECMWAPAYVGKCTGGSVALAIESPSTCLTTPIRVCAGLHGCYGPGSPVGYPSGVPYVKYQNGRASACVGSTLVFSCPMEEQFGGYYSVMTRPQAGTGGISPIRPVSPAVIKVSGSGSYPATEAAVFPYLEGAFYGNVFEPDQLRVTCKVTAAAPTVLACMAGNVALPPPCSPSSAGGCPPAVRPTMPYRNVYACYSGTPGGGDAEAVAYLNDRICAQRDPDDEPCFPHPPRRCSARCTWQGQGGLYDSCQGVPDASGATTNYRPITTYLNGPCDLIGGADLCGKLRGQLLGGPSGGAGGQADNGGTPGQGTTGRGPRGCAGCSSGEAAGAAMPTVLAVMLLLAMNGPGRSR